MRPYFDLRKVTKSGEMWEGIDFNADLPDDPPGFDDMDID